MNIEVTNTQTYQTINVLVLALLIAFFVTKESILIFFSIFLLLNNLIFFNISKIITDYWLAFSRVIGGINSKILLSIVFFLFLIPISYLYRFFNQENVSNLKENNKDSYFGVSNLKNDRESFLKQW